MKLEKIRNVMKENNAEAVLIAKPENRRYFSGFTGSAGSVLITLDKAYFFADFRYVDQANAQCEGFEIVEISAGEDIEYIKKLAIKSIMFEDDSMNVAAYKKLQENLTNISLLPLGNTLHVIRGTKNENEIEKIKKAAKIGDEAFKHVVKYIKVGVSEIDIALELEFVMRRLGASACSFESIVASGVRSALPHGVASNKLVEKGDFITLDYGCIYNGYCSDMTRTIVVGNASEDQKSLYDLVLKAQMAAFEGIKPGNNCKMPDDIARGIITEAGYGGNFGHGLGHGVGLEIHEYPNINSKGENIILEKNMVITNEPGVYLSGKYGVRIEDLVLVTEKGYEILSNSQKQLLEI